MINNAKIRCMENDSNEISSELIRAVFIYYDDNRLFSSSNQRLVNNVSFKVQYTELYVFIFLH